ncbi:putative lipase [Myxococcus xanthus DK 1622]|uniref:Lipase n=2 Tax=Myxococcaceae TaxID=31 RepID=Q1CYW9_MYXXD|nr:putative lipase [Myxococcus xanthus DK 1622]NOJ57969.1 alpha/beta hydrolase [Myxococcus xanthus]QPM78644.1 alpha/beta hydrolase [Myxococcus xanthus]QVW67714.1 alpha/beta hydrolase [Myxococcus xanthus DZ2]UEO06164.1 alpha/beta hydrolase [Myxococcus xanthus DZ2]
MTSPPSPLPPMPTLLAILHIVGCVLLAAVFFAPAGVPTLVHLLKGIVREYSLAMLLPALLTALVAVWISHVDVWRWLRWGTAACALLVGILAVWPAASAWRMARAADTPLRLREYFRPLVGARPLPSHTVRFAVVEGHDLHADVFLPDASATRARPAVLYFHGGGWRGGERGYARAWADFLTARGYALISFDYRLFPPATGLKAPGDVKCGIRWVKDHAATYGIDPDRLVLFGESAGGHLASLAGYTEGDARLPSSCAPGDTSVAAIISFYAPSDLVAYAASAPAPLVGFTGVPQEGHRELYELLSPINHVGPRSPPTLLLHGGADSVVPLDASQAMAARLAQAGVPHTLFTLPYAEHGFDIWDGGFGRQLARAQVGRFLQQHAPVN